MLLGEDSCALLVDLVGYIVAVRAAPGGADVIDEADLLKDIRVGEADAKLLLRVDLLVKLGLLLCILAAHLQEIKIYVKLKILDLAKLLPIKVH